MKNLIIFLCLFYSHLMSAQILFSIDEMDVQNIYIIDCKDYIEEGSEEGPAISMKFTLKNNCDSTIKLTPANSTMWLSFRFKNRRYKTDIFALGFLDNEMIEILPNDEYHNFAFTRIFLGTNIHKESGNYLLELIEVLPTLKLHYENKDQILISSEIKNVNVME